MGKVTVMPTTKTWEEELVLEWLLLEGYLAEANLLLRAGDRGGRNEVDVVGCRFLKDGSLEIKHIEIGALAESESKNIDKVCERFNKEHKEDIIKIIKWKFGLENLPQEIIKYKPIFIATNLSPNSVKKLKNKLKNTNIEILSFKEFIKIVLETIEKWKNTQKNLGFVKDPINIILPQTYRLMRFLETLKTNNMLKI